MHVDGTPLPNAEGECVCERECVRERESVCERECVRERDSVCVRERERLCVRMCVCVCEEHLKTF